MKIFRVSGYAQAALCFGITMAGVVATHVHAMDTHHCISDGYMNHDALAERVHQLAASFDQCHIEIIGRSIEERAIFALTLTDDLSEAQQRPALLITAGLDGRHWVGSETAVRVAERLLEDHSALLESMTVYIIPRANPDGAERNLGSINYGHKGNLRPVDMDRDGEVNEDGPNDLNGDGVITMMRRLKPTLDDPPTHLPDPNEPRLLKTPNRAKGEVAIYSIYIEGIDEDGDGQIAEDGPGEVDLDRNFPHLYPEHATGAGLHQISEPETRALAEFVVQHRNIVASITYGRHDNMINTPDHRRMDVTGRTPVGIHADDRQLYEDLGELYKESTGQTRAPQEDVAGSFHAWLYAHRGIPSIATVVWGRPDVEDAPGDDEHGEDGDYDVEDASRDPISGTWTGTVDLSAMQEMAEGVPGELPITLHLVHEDDGVTGELASDMGTIDVGGTYDEPESTLVLTGDAGDYGAIDMELTITENVLRGQARSMGMSMAVNVRREAFAEESTESQEAHRRDGQPADAEAAAWLAYSDSLGGIGFVEWQLFDHPQLGPVEIGGFVPGFKMNPPAGELDELADKQTAFVVNVIDRRPKLHFVGPEVKRLGPGLYEVRLGMINDGWLPTMTAMGQRARISLPVVLRLSTELDQIVSGARINRAWGVEGQSGRYDTHWILRESADTIIEIELLNHQLGDFLLTFPLREDTELSMTDLPEDRR